MLSCWTVRRTWLFMRDSESIWLQRAADGALRVALHGPLTHRREFNFHGELELLDFISDVERRLVEKGWTLQHTEPTVHRVAAVRRGMSATKP